MSSSPYSNTHEDITVPSTNFHQHFRQQISALQDQIESLSAPDITADSRKVTGENILAGITKLSATLADASSDLASYDQRSYNQVGKHFAWIERSFMGTPAWKNCSPGQHWFCIASSFVQ